jgi:hypothetical protein
MDPTFFYEYVNQKIYYYNHTKYDAIMLFLDDTTIDTNYKLIQEVMDELNTTNEYNNIMSQNNNNMLFCCYNNKKNI